MTKQSSYTASSLDGPALEREIAQIIYDTAYQPGVEDRDGFVMPPFEEAEAEELGGFDQVILATRLVLDRIRRA